MCTEHDEHRGATSPVPEPGPDGDGGEIVQEAEQDQDFWGV